MGDKRVVHIVDDEETIRGHSVKSTPNNAKGEQPVNG